MFMLKWHSLWERETWQGSMDDIFFLSGFPSCFSEFIPLKSVRWGPFPGFCHCSLKVEWGNHLSTWFFCLFWFIHLPESLSVVDHPQGTMYQFCIQKHIPHTVLHISEFTVPQINPRKQMSSYPAWHLPTVAPFSSFSSEKVGKTTFRSRWVQRVPSFWVKAGMWQGSPTLMSWRTCPEHHCGGAAWLGVHPLCASLELQLPQLCSS